MARQNESRPDPLTQGKGRTDEVDQSKGIFPPGVPHPEGAEIRMPGSLGGGPYEESGRGGVDFSPGQSASGTLPIDEEPATGQVGGEAPQGERAEERETKGVLPPHEQGKK
jgi:hypothetical protein